MEPFPERTLAISPLDRRRGTQDNYEQDENPYDIKIATNGILSALTHGLVSKDRVNEVARFFKDTESNTPERMFENANLLMLHDAISFLDSYRADVRNRINMGYAIDPIAEVANFNNIFSHKLELYNSFLNTLSENFKNVNNEAVQNYKNSLMDVLNFVNNGGAINYILSDEQSQNYAQSANVLSNIRDNASSIHNNIMQRQTQPQPQQGPSQGSDSADKKPSPKQINEEGSLDFSSKIDLSLIKNAMDLHVAYGAFGVAMACAPIFAPVYTVALLWFIINYNLKPCEVKSENKIKFATKKIIEDFLKKNDINLPPPPLKNVLPPTLDGPNAHQRNNISLQKQTDSNFGLPRGNIPMFVEPVIPANRPPISVTHTVDDILLDIDLGGVKPPKAVTHPIRFSGIPIIIPRPKPSKSPTPPKPSTTPESSKSPTPPKPSKSTTPPESSSTPESSKSPTPPKPSTTPESSKSTTPPKPSTTDDDDKNISSSSKSINEERDHSDDEKEKKEANLVVNEFSINEREMEGVLQNKGLFGIEQGIVEQRDANNSKKITRAAAQVLFDKFKEDKEVKNKYKPKNATGLATTTTFDDLAAFLSYAYSKGDASYIECANAIIEQKLTKIKKEIDDIDEEGKKYLNNMAEREKLLEQKKTLEEERIGINNKLKQIKDEIQKETKNIEKRKQLFTKRFKLTKDLEEKNRKLSDLDKNEKKLSNSITEYEKNKDTLIQERIALEWLKIALSDIKENKGKDNKIQEDRKSDKEKFEEKVNNVSIKDGNTKRTIIYGSDGKTPKAVLKTDKDGATFKVGNLQTYKRSEEYSGIIDKTKDVKYKVEIDKHGEVAIKKLNKDTNEYESVGEEIDTTLKEELVAVAKAELGISDVPVVNHSKDTEVGVSEPETISPEKSPKASTYPDLRPKESLEKSSTKTPPESHTPQSRRLKTPEPVRPRLLDAFAGMGANDSAGRGTTPTPPMVGGKPRTPKTPGK